jgi:DNA repair protein SbcC/Rad50
MITSLFSRNALHQHADPAQRILGIAALPPDSGELAQLLAADPAPGVRIAAARRCTVLATLGSAWETEADAAVRLALASALRDVLAQTQDSVGAQALLAADGCTDAVRIEVARCARDAERRRAAIAGIRDEAALVELALLAGHAETRMAAAERVSTPDGLRRLADAAKNKDHGVARLARQRIDAIKLRQKQEADADAIIAQLEALATEPGPILTAVIELNRRWQALDMSGETARLARCEIARQAIQARFEREQNEQRARMQFERRLNEWIEALRTAAPAAPDALTAMRTELAALRDEARGRSDDAALVRLDQAESRITRWEEELQALAGTLALVVEAEQLAAGTSIDHADLPARWQALNRAIRTAELTRRFEAAMTTVEQRRLAQIQAAQQEANAGRQQVHALLHNAEQALAAGQVQAARAAADEIKALKTGAGLLPKPTTQRLGRLVQQLAELERWESFGQQNARIQLCERAEAAAKQTLDAPQLALEVQKLRNEWKALDQQHAGVPKALWERFDGACEKAYAPAAKYFAELAAQRKEARKRRDEFIAAAAAQAPTLLGEPIDWRALERWLRETDRGWREGDLGSVDPGAWKKLDLRFRAALAPLREAMSAARDRAKAGRQALIEEAAALSSKATEREVPSQIKAIQARWQAEAKELSLAQRDERALWQQFRAACDAVFDARQSKRKEEDGRKNEHRHALQELCAQLEQLARDAGKEDQELRRALRDLQDQWKQKAGASGPDLRDLESRFTKGRTALEAMLSARVRSREAAVWQTLAAKERLCEELDALVHTGSASAPVEAEPLEAQSAAARERWEALPVLPAAWEQKMLARRDAALGALSEAAAAAKYLARIEQGTVSRREVLLELELLLGMESPPEVQPQRLALQVKKLKERFSAGASTGAVTAAERLVAWCAQPGVADALDRQRFGKILSKVEQAR